MNFATLTLTAAKREIKRLAYAKKKVQVFSFLTAATAWLVFYMYYTKLPSSGENFKREERFLLFYF